MSREKILCTLGKFDIPIIQMQPAFIVDLLDSNVILFGSAMSGKTTFIKTLVNIPKIKSRYSFLILAELCQNIAVCRWYLHILIIPTRNM